MRTFPAFYFWHSSTDSSARHSLVTTDALDDVLHFRGNAFFHCWPERTRAAVIHHGATRFVPTFLEDSKRGDVSHDVVRVPGDPRVFPAVLGLEAKPVVDNHLAAE